MDFDHVYLFGNAFIRGALHVDPIAKISNPIALARGEWRPSAPIAFRHHSGGRPRDLVGTTYATLDLLSARTVSLLRDEGFTGWTTFPVQVNGKDGLLLEGYEGLVVTGRCGSIDNSKSAEVWRDPPVPRGERYRAWLGFYFDPSTWDGSDIFGPAGTAYVFVVERVKHAMELAKLTNFDFQPLSAIERLML